MITTRTTIQRMPLIGEAEDQVRSRDWLQTGVTNNLVHARTRISDFKSIPAADWNKLRGRIAKVRMENGETECLLARTVLGIVKQKTGACEIFDALFRKMLPKEDGLLLNRRLLTGLELGDYSNAQGIGKISDAQIQAYRQRWDVSFKVPPGYRDEQILAAANRAWHMEKRSRTGRHAQTFKKSLYGKQGGKCNGCGQWFKQKLMEVDHIEADLAGDRDVSTNLQLLCKGCNAAKGNRGMDYLFMRLSQKRS